ncbi:MAG: hypothetical protein ACRDQU_19820 [Pseudonocardiaceae bacterium]
MTRRLDGMVATGHVLALATGYGHGWRQVGELMMAFGLSSTVGVERQLRGKRGCGPSRSWARQMG